jgi:hypothetical protein
VGRRWFCRKHFVCTACGRGITVPVIHHGSCYCQKHGCIYTHACEYCKETIAGATIRQLKWNAKTYHPECFVCRVCGIKLEVTTAKRFHNRPHCQACFEFRIEERRSPKDCRKHTPRESAQRRLRFKGRGVAIVSTPEYRGTDDPVTETVNETNAETFEPDVRARPSPVDPDGRPTDWRLFEDGM